MTKYSDVEILDSVDIWGDYFEIVYKGTNKDNGIEFWLCINSKNNNVVYCSSELQAHKICWVAYMKHNPKRKNFPFGITVNKKADLLFKGKL